jgi:hypothetical protein
MNLSFLFNMKRKRVFVLLPIFVILILIIIVLTGGYFDKPKKQSSLRGYRSFYLGIVPNPKTIPETTFEDMASAYEEAGNLAEIAMVWTNTNIGQTEKLKKNKLIKALKVYGLKPILTLNFATIKRIPGKGLQYVIDSPENIEPSLSNPEFKALWVNEARSLAKEFKPDYISLGNEINDYFYHKPDDVEPYLTLYDEAYSAIKEASPSSKVFVVFSYTHLIDNGQWDLIKKFNNRVDLIGLTTYPWKHFKKPEHIPDDYYSRILSYTNKPIAFTEIGWPSAGGGSEDEQATFLKIFLDRIKGMNIETVNWLFLHEQNINGILATMTKPELGTVALKRADGTRKKIYDEWLSLKQIPYSK